MVALVALRRIVRHQVLEDVVVDLDPVRLLPCRFLNLLERRKVAPIRLFRSM